MVYITNINQDYTEYPLLCKLYSHTKDAYIDGKPRLCHPDSCKIVWTENVFSVILIERDTLGFDKNGLQELRDIHQL